MAGTEQILRISEYLHSRETISEGPWFAPPDDLKITMIMLLLCRTDNKLQPKLFDSARETSSVDSDPASLGMSNF